MRVARTQHRHQAHQLAFRHFAEHRRGQLLADQDGVLLVDQVLLALFLQVGEQAAAEVLDVRGALAQVVIVHQLETGHVLHHHLAQGALGPLARADHALDLEADGGIVEHHQVDVEERTLFGAQLGFQLAGEAAHVFAYRFQGLLEAFDLGFDVIDRAIRHHLQVSRRQHHHRGPHGGARCARHADELGFLGAFTLAAKTANGAGGLGVGDNASQLRAHGDEEGFLALVELAALLLLHHQDAHHPPVVDDRGAKEGGETLFTGFGEVAVTGVIGGVLEVQRLFAGAHQAHQAFVGGHADLADGALVQALGGHEHETVGLRVQQVDRADLAAHGLLDPLHDDRQRRLQVLGGVHFLDDLAQRVEHG
ncbi:hypothetical protein FQZ97_529260 [compost metagenome]